MTIPLTNNFSTLSTADMGATANLPHRRQIQKGHHFKILKLKFKFMTLKIDFEF